jgi:hypothetical protein
MTEQNHTMTEQYIRTANGNKFYYCDPEMTVLHRTDGPAVECPDSYKAWYVDGRLHRTDGPAVEWHDGYKDWFVDGKRLTREQFNARFVN